MNNVILSFSIEILYDGYSTSMDIDLTAQPVAIMLNGTTFLLNSSFLPNIVGIGSGNYPISTGEATIVSASISGNILSVAFDPTTINSSLAGVGDSISGVFLF